MEVISNRDEMIFKTVKDDKTFYSIGLSRKLQDGSYENGYMPVRFKKDVNVENKTKIKIKNAWIDFYKVENITNTYIFINDFEIVNN